MTETDTTTTPTGRTFAPPASISPEAQRLLAAAPNRGAPPDAQQRVDVEDWRQSISQRNAQLAVIMEPIASAVEADVDVVDAGEARIFVVRPRSSPAEAERRAFLEVHGGGFIVGGGDCCPLFGRIRAGVVGVTTWAVDYRTPPDFPYPAPLDDCVAAYRLLLESHGPDEIVVGGGSAGGNLAAALIFRAHDEGLPMPAGLVLHTPELDLTESGDSFQTNLGLDSMLSASLAPSIRLYAGEADLTHPYLSPLFGEIGDWFPRTILLCGTRDLFLSNTVRMHRALRRAGVDADLHVFEAMPHGGFGGAPEDAELSGEVRRFVDSCWIAG